MDEEAALVSALVDDPTGVVDETAIWGRGDHNSLVVVLRIDLHVRTIFTWRLESPALELRSA